MVTTLMLALTYVLLFKEKEGHISIQGMHSLEGGYNSPFASTAQVRTSRTTNLVFEHRRPEPTELEPAR